MKIVYITHPVPDQTAHQIAPAWLDVFEDLNFEQYRHYLLPVATIDLSAFLSPLTSPQKIHLVLPHDNLNASSLSFEVSNGKYKIIDEDIFQGHDAEQLKADDISVEKRWYGRYLTLLPYAVMSKDEYLQSSLFRETRAKQTSLSDDWLHYFYMREQAFLQYPPIKKMAKPDGISYREFNKTHYAPGDNDRSIIQEEPFVFNDEYHGEYPTDPAGERMQFIFSIKVAAFTDELADYTIHVFYSKACQLVKQLYTIG